MIHTARLALMNCPAIKLPLSRQEITAQQVLIA